MKKIRSFFEDLVPLFYPNSCGICGKNLIKDEDHYVYFVCAKFQKQIALKRKKIA